MNNRGNKITIGVFAVLIFGLSALNIVTPDIGFSESENRYLNQRPKFSFENLISGEYTKNMESYLSDQIVGRDLYVSIKSQSEYIIGKRDTKDVYFGKNGYLINKYDKWNVDEKILENNLEAVASYINKTKELLGENRAHVMFIPTSQEINIDLIPPNAPKYNQKQALESIIPKIPENAYIDAYKILSELENSYYKTDHHWSTDGAFEVYLSLKALGITELEREDFVREVVSNEFYGTTYSKARLFNTKPDEIVRYLPKSGENFVMDINMGQTIKDTLYDESYLEKRDQYSYFLGGNNPIVKITGENKNGKKLLIIKDSFAHSIATILANDFEQVHLLDLRYYNGSTLKYIEDNEITDTLVLYNFATLQSDTSISRIEN